MLDVLIALAPVGIVSVCLNGWGTLMLILVSLVSAVGFEWMFQTLTKQKVRIGDLSAAVTGLLVAYVLPTTAPWWLAVIGTAIAILLVKQLFGGLGKNFVNPALCSRAILLASWPVLMTSFMILPDAISTATPLAVTSLEARYSYLALFLGNVPGCIGETSKIALLCGAAYLVYRRVISLRIPLSFLATFAIITAIFHTTKKDIIDFDVLYHLLSGGVILGAFFMATDYTTSPVSPVGQIVFGIGCGLFTGIIRLFGSLPEGTMYGILVMNLFVPLIDRYIRPKHYGEARNDARNTKSIS